jgi:type VI secretion system FHA domain protein
MPLTLKIVSKQRHILGADSLRVFSVHGGSIGRAADNDWVLPDPDRFISGHHATIDYRDGAYYLRDTSTNGVFVNRSEQPVGRGAPLRLYDGDELRMGDYIFQVMIVNVSKDGADDSGEGDRTPRLRRKQEDVSALSLKLLGEEADAMASAQAVSEPKPEKPQKVPPGSSATVRITDAEIETRTAFGPKDPDELRPPAASGLPSLPDAPIGDFSGSGRRDFTEAVRLLMKAAGLDSTRVAHGDEEEVVVLMGRLLRASIEGLQTVLRARAATKSQFRIDQTVMQPAGNNPLKMMPSAQDVLEQMFYEGSTGYLEPLEAIEEAFRDLEVHQSATIKALLAAFRDLLDKLKPEALEERFQQPGKRTSLLSGVAKSTFWEQYPEAYRAIAGFRDDNFAAVLKARFGEAYAREIQQAVMGADRGKKR